MERNLTPLDLLTIVYKTMVWTASSLLTHVAFAVRMSGSANFP